MKSLYHFIFLACLVCSIHAQNQKNDLVNLNDIDYYRATELHIDSILKVSREMQQSLDPCERVKGRNIESNMYYRNGDYKKSETIALGTLELIKNPQTDCEREIKFNVLGRLFWIKKNTNKFKEALDYLILKEELSKKIERKGISYHIRELSNNANKALIKHILGFDDEAIELLQSTLNSFDERDFTTTKKEKYTLIFQKSSAFNILGDAYYSKGKKASISDIHLDSAFVFYKKAYEAAMLFDPPHENSKPLYNLKRVKVLTKQDCYQKALDLLNSFTPKEKELTIEDYTFYKSVIYQNLADTDSTLFYGNSYINNNHITPNTKENKIVIYDILAKEYDKIHQPDSAYKYSELVLKELSEFDNNITEASKSHYLYDFEKIKEANQSTINKAHQRQLLWAILFSFTLLISIYVIYSLSRKRKKRLQLNLSSQEKVVQKKDYNIDKRLEKRVLKHLKELEKSTEYLDHNFNITQLAKELKTNTSYLSFIINKNTNLTFKQYLLRLRINYLIEKLKTDKKYRRYTIQTLGEEIGYTNASAFTRAFRKQVGVTPSTYIKKLKNN